MSKPVPIHQIYVEISHLIENFVSLVALLKKLEAQLRQQDSFSGNHVQNLMAIHPIAEVFQSRPKWLADKNINEAAMCNIPSSLAHIRFTLQWRIYFRIHCLNYLHV